MSNETQLAKQSAENNLAWLQIWYADQCDGEWEHAYGISIGTLDNPVWKLEINLLKTALADVPFDSVEREGEEDWFVCKANGKTFKAYGGAKNLDDMIDAFRKWATKADKKEQE